MDSVAANTVAPIPRTRYVVVDVSGPQQLSLSQLIFDLAVRTNYHLLMVGVEGNPAIRANPARLEHYSRRGAALSVRGSALVETGPGARAADDFVRRRLVHAVLDEMLGVDKELWSALSKRVSELTPPDITHAQMIGNPQQLLRGKLLAHVEPVAAEAGNLRRLWRRMAAGPLS